MDYLVSWYGLWVCLFWIFVVNEEVSFFSGMVNVLGLLRNGLLSFYIGLDSFRFGSLI